MLWTIASKGPHSGQDAINDSNSKGSFYLLSLLIDLIVVDFNRCTLAIWINNDRFDFFYRRYITFKLRWGIGFKLCW